MRIEDHWPFRWGNAELVILEQNGLASALQFSFPGQPAHLSPNVQKHESGNVKATITGRDTLLPVLRARVRKALSYIQCFFDIDFGFDEIDIQYIAENENERAQIAMSGMKLGRQKPTLALSFDYVTRSLMASLRGNDDPEFATTFASATRSSYFDGDYISSFRYSFLLFEALYGEGHFRTEKLKAALRSNPDFLVAVEAARREVQRHPPRHDSDTAALLRSETGVDAVIDHVVEKRGFYFHANRRRKDAWRPDQQEKAEALAWLCLQVVQEIVQSFATPMFDADLSAAHFKLAEEIGAIVVLSIDYEFVDNDERFVRNANFRMRYPGTKVTARMAQEAAKNFIQAFEENLPAARLLKAKCTLEPNGMPVFDIVVHVPVEDINNGAQTA